ncbi:hypothetical protein Q4I30_000973 [Leishmania utingensis]|uniref:Ankyrin repeat protein n=1 Tax=Leishmania utingensis TaxID=653362 RepID=A0AAW3AZA6_9TRYP
MSSVSFTGSLSSFSSSPARAQVDDAEAFERFRDCVRRKGDSTYGQQVDAKGCSALHYATMHGFMHGANFLSRIGAEPNVLGKAGYAPLHYAALYGTKVCQSAHITDEPPSAAVQGARHAFRYIRR